MKAKRKEFKIGYTEDDRAADIEAAEAFVTSCADKLITVLETSTKTISSIVVWYWTE